MSSAPDRPGSGLCYRDLQRWFLERIVAPHRRDGAAAAPLVPEREVAQVIRPSATLSAEERMNVYVQQYIWRLQGIVAQEHPTLVRLMGDDACDELALEYISRFPPRGFTLNDLCHALPYYLAHHCAREDAPLLHDVARLERAISDAYDTYPIGRVTADDLRQVPAEAWPEMRFQLDPSVRVMAFAYDVVAAYNAAVEGEPLPELTPRPTWAVVWRAQHKIWRRPIGHARYQTLAALAAGETVLAALERAAEVWDGDEDALQETVFTWFSEWVEDGFFARLILP